MRPRSLPNLMQIITKNTGARMTSGTIFNAKLDISHPIGYGYDKEAIHTFRNSNNFLEPAKNQYANPMVYTDKPLASGYVHPENLGKNAKYRNHSGEKAWQRKGNRYGGQS
jgi:hypothetical protein